MLDIDSIFAEDGLLPAQFRTAAGHARPEHALWQAVFAQALEDLRGGAHLNREKSRKRAQMIAEARAWMTDRSWTGVSSFPWVCEVLGLDAASVRTALVEPAKNEVSERAAAGSVAGGAIRSSR